MKILNRNITSLILVFICVILFTPSDVFANTPMTAHLEVTLSHSDDGLLTGGKTVKAKLYSGSSTTPIWEKQYLNIVFNNGNATIKLGPFTDSQLNINDPKVGIEVDGNEVKIDLTSTPYAIQSKLAEKALQLSDTNALYVSSSNSRIGLGTTSPSQKLEVSGNIKLSSTANSIIFGDGTTLKSKNDISGTSRWVDGSSSAIYYTSGNIGIGTNSPQQSLHVSGNIRFSTLTSSSSENTVLVLQSNGDILHRDIPSSIWDGDSDTTYTGSKGVKLNGTTFELDQQSASSGQVLKWNASSSQWVPSSDLNTGASYASEKGITLNGTTFSLDQQGASSGQVLKWNATSSQWVPSSDLSIEDTNTTYNASKGIVLNGSTFELDQQSASAGQVLKWNASSSQWVPSSDLSSEDTNTTYNASKGIALNGSTFELDQQSASSGQVLKWNANSSQWVPSSDLNEGSNYSGEKGITLNGTAFSLDQQGASAGQVLKWNASTSQWSPSSDTNTSYTGENGVTLNGTEFKLVSNLHWDSSNTRLGINNTDPKQTLDINGLIRLRPEGSLPSLASGDEGAIIYSGGIFQGWDGSKWQTLSSVNVTVDNSNLWTTNGNNIYVTPTDNIGIGISTPQAKLHVSGNIRVSNLSSSGSEESVVLIESDGDFVQRELPASIWDGDNDTTYTGNKGITLNGSVFEMDQQGASAGQVLKWNASSNQWVPSSDLNTEDTNTTYNASKGVVLNGSTFELDQQSASAGQVLKWNASSSQWVPSADISNSTSYTAEKGITLNGTAFSLDQQGATNGQVLKWNGSSNLWVPTADTSTTYTAGEGLQVTGNEFLLASGLSYTSSKFGIGTSNATATLALSDNTAGSTLFKAVGVDSQVFSIDTSANVAIGFSTTSGYRLAVKGYSYLDAFVTPYVASIGTTNVGSTTAGPTLKVASVTSNATSSILNVIDKAGSSVFWIQEDGKVGIGTTSPSTYKLRVVGGSAAVDTGQSWAIASDKRLKTDIRTLDNPLPSLNQLRGVYYKSKSSSNGKDNIGFIAQEVEEVYPEVVVTDEKGYKALDYSRLTAVLLEAIKQQQKEIDQLKKKVENLESK